MARSGGQAKKGTATTKSDQSKKARSASAAPRPLRANAKHEEELYQDVPPLMGESVNRDIAGVVLAVIAVASMIAVVAPASAPVTSAVSSFYHLGFGLGAYVLPVAMLAVAALLFLRDRAPVNARTTVGIAVIFVFICSALSLMVPNTDLSTVAMFESHNLASSGGYLGAFVASALQNALGKSIAMVLCVGGVILGMVIIGFSVSQFVQGAAARAAQIAQKRKVDLNDNPWGEAVPAAALQHRRDAPVAAAGKQQSLFDDIPAPETTFLGNRETTVLPRPDDDEDDGDPFVDVKDEYEGESAKTTLIPVKERFAKAVTAAASKPKRGKALDVIADATDSLEATSAAEPAMDTPPWIAANDAAPVEKRPLPDFLQSSPARAQQTSADRDADAYSDEHAQASSQQGRAKAEPRPEDIKVKPASGVDDSDDERQLPPSSMLKHSPKAAASSYSEKELEQTAAALQSTLQEFGLHSRVVGWISGPTVTTFKVQPGEGERVSRISNLEDDIALSLATDSVRIFAPIPGTSLVGIEIPNRSRQNVSFGDILPYVKGGPLEFALGRDAEGTPMVADLAKMPHLLIAGTTGSGKSVVISSILMSLLMRTFPEDVRLIMIDPKRVEFAPYDGLPHLYVPVVTEPKQAASALQWAVSEMERRLKIFERIGVRKIAIFNEKQAAGEFDHYDNPPTKMPYLVIVIDELSDLMMVAGKDVEASIVRIAQLGRAAGIHMIVATQRPSSNVVTGLIKANITNRIGLTVATGIDSRVILDQTGAEKLLGQGDMLFSRVDWGKPKRIQGCYVSDEEIVDVVGFVKEQSAADYHEEILSAVTPALVGGAGAGPAGMGSSEPSEDDPLLWDAARIVVDSQLGSTSGLQRRLKVGYARAGRIMDMLEEKGVVGPPDGSKPREVLLDAEGLAELEAVEAQLAAEDEFGGF